MQWSTSSPEPPTPTASRWWTGEPPVRLDALDEDFLVRRSPSEDRTPRSDQPPHEPGSGPLRPRRRRLRRERGSRRRPGPRVADRAGPAARTGPRARHRHGRRPHGARVRGVHRPWWRPTSRSPCSARRGAFIMNQGVAGVHFLAADAEALPFRDESFGVVTCRIAAHHFRRVARGDPAGGPRPPAGRLVPRRGHPRPRRCRTLAAFHARTWSAAATRATCARSASSSGRRSSCGAVRGLTVIDEAVDAEGPGLGRVDGAGPR